MLYHRVRHVSRKLRDMQSDRVTRSLDTSAQSFFDVVSIDLFTVPENLPNEAVTYVLVLGPRDEVCKGDSRGPGQVVLSIHDAISDSER